MFFVKQLQPKDCYIFFRQGLPLRLLIKFIPTITDIVMVGTLRLFHLEKAIRLFYKDSYKAQIF